MRPAGFVVLVAADPGVVVTGGALVAGVVVVVVGVVVVVVGVAFTALPLVEPAAFVAMTANEYCTSSVRPDNTQVDAGGVMVQENPPGVAVTVYDDGSPPPAPRATVTVICDVPDCTTVSVGAAGRATGVALTATL